MSHVLICHDNPGFAEAKAELWRSEGFDATFYETARQTVDAINLGLGDIRVLILHKDFGDYSHESRGAEQVLRALNARDEYEMIRRGYISGEYPKGEYRAISDQMDFYIPTSINPHDPWLLELLRRGYITRHELQRRGVSVVKPEHISIDPERGTGLFPW